MAALVSRLLIASVLFVLPAEADPFLREKPLSLTSDSDVLLNELERVIGERQRAIVEERVVRLTLALQPTFQALLRTSEDRLEQAGVRYLLHRYFVDRHGWFVQGIDTNGEAWNSSTPAEILGRQVGTEAREIFEERLRTRGLSLPEAAVLAATLEGLVRSEMLERLHAAYRLAGVSETANASTSDVIHVIDVYMLMYVLGLSHKTVTPVTISAQMQSIDEVYPDWADMRKWLHSVRDEVLSFTAASAASSSFASTAHVLEEVSSRYGRWQNHGCLRIKDMLLKLEQPGTGRVPLASFYNASLNGAWQLSESRPYLRQMGALDERNVQQPSVVIPNYVNAPSNCVASSAFYSVCCISECEAILGHLENRLASPAAVPGRITEVIAGLPSATVHVPRNLPMALRRRLEDIAVLHGGQVPLHGRLFMQWLHHAYPNECSFPHLSGSSKPVTVEQFMRQTGQDPTASPAAMKQEISQAHNASSVYHADLPWLTEEELFVSWSTRHGVDVSLAFSDVAEGVLLVATVMTMSVAITLVRSLTKAHAAVGRKSQPKLSV